MMKNDNRFIAGITTFNPRISRLEENLKAIVGQADKVIVVDNGSKNAEEIRKVASIYANVVMQFNKDNLGIASAMNVIGEYAYKNGYKWFLTLDQDSVCPPNLSTEYRKVMNDSVGIISPYIEQNPPFIKQLLRIKSKEEREFYDDKREFLRLKYTVSSGQLIQTKAWREAQGFWEYLFIDYVDHELCYHLTQLGYDILVAQKCELSHEPGIPCKVLGISTAKQSAMREYYYARNSRMVYWLYRKQYMSACRRFPVIASIKRMANAILIREKVFQKMKAILWGIWDAHVWKCKYLKKGRVPKNLLENRRY